MSDVITDEVGGAADAAGGAGDAAGGAGDEAEPTGTPRGPRRAGVLIPLFSLRRASSWGAGDVGDLPAMARWAAAAGFSFVQLLPVNEVLAEDGSPYAAISTFALDPVVLDVDALEDFQTAGGREALSPAQRQELDDLDREPLVRWPRVRALKRAAAHLAFARFRRDEWGKGTPRARELQAFIDANHGWLDDHALFKIIHGRHAGSWLDWPAPLRDRDPEALWAVRADGDAWLEQAWLQWQLDRQWRAARAACAALGVSLMGDLPFVVATDSADVWSRRDRFRVDVRVGTPPDAFSETGQDWGLPAYDWDALAAADFDRLKARATRAGELFSSYRVDHVIGLYRTFVREASEAEGRFWPADEPAQIALGERVLSIFAEHGEVVAEDLGAIPKFLRASLARLGIPGYRLLRWEQKGGVFRPPSRWSTLTVACNATHDTDTTAEWYDALDDAERAALAEVPGLELVRERPRFDEAVRDAILAVLYAAPSELVIVPLQDALGWRERINVPGTVAESNWSYRLPRTLAELAAEGATLARLRDLARSNERAPGATRGEDIGAGAPGGAG